MALNDTRLRPWINVDTRFANIPIVPPRRATSNLFNDLLARSNPETTTTTATESEPINDTNSMWDAALSARTEFLRTPPPLRNPFVTARVFPPPSPEANEHFRGFARGNISTEVFPPFNSFVNIPPLETIGTTRRGATLADQLTTAADDATWYSTPPNTLGNSSVGSFHITSGSINIPEPQLVMTDKTIVKFLKEKLNLKVSLLQAGKGFEIKVSLNLIDTDEEILSDSDYVETEY